jgi:branched-chain amino acid transport system substrate-binding protein
MSRRVVACCVANVALAVFATACRHQAAESIAIGAVVPLSGVNAPLGEYARNGIDMAVGEVNAAGGVNGKVLRVIYGDSQSTVDAGVPAYQMIVTGSRPPAILAILNPIVVKVAQIADREKTVLLNCGAQDPDLRKAGPFVFNLVPDAIEEARALAGFAISKLGLKDAATLAVDRNSGMAAAAEFAREFTRLGGRVVREDLVEMEGQYFAPAIDRLASVSPSATFVAGPPAATTRALRQAAVDGFTTRWLTDSSFEIDGAMTAAGPAAEGVTFAGVRHALPDSARARKFVADYKSRFGYEPEIYAATCYDGIHALAGAIKTPDTVSSAAIANGLRARASDGVMGPLDFTDATWVARPFEIRTVKSGRAQIVPER